MLNIKSARLPIALVLMLCATAAQAVTIEEVEERMVEAEQFRVVEFSPGNYARARQALDDAKNQIASGNNEKAGSSLDESASYIEKAMKTSQMLTTRLPQLVESRDRMQMAAPEHQRADLAERAERDFGRVVEAVEDDDMAKAEAQAKLARVTLHAAQSVAAREQYARPISKGIAAARKVHARKYSPNALNASISAQREIETLIKNDPDAQVKMHAASKRGEISAERAMRIAALGERLNRNPAEIEAMVNEEEARFLLLGKYLGIDLSNAKNAEEQARMLQQAIEEMENSYRQQLRDSDNNIEELSGKLAKYEGELSKYQTDLASMEELRRKLQIKRDAEAKIKRLTKLFDPQDVEILLTPDADVILRMKNLNFRSGSAVIPPDTYSMLDHATESMVLFADRAVRIEGHTDAVGANDYNQKLSERRAEAVKFYLMEKMQEERTVEAAGFGEEKPIANNETAKGREKNRRIDIVLLVPRL
ncbi:MAG: OmpA family protein [Mariprofundaceae bacterium]|nr:OmpA family protein [Mariprofundaceae bacterium]